MSKKKQIRVFILLGVATVLSLLLFFMKPYLEQFSGFIDAEKLVKVKAYLDKFGFFKHFAVLFIQVLQVFVFFLPGELAELLAGYISGTVGGALICLLGVYIGTVLLYKVSLLLGGKYILRIKKSKIYKKASFLQEGDTGNFMVFLLFLLPGLPKDALNLLAPLMKMPFRRFLILSLVARIPSIVSSTYVGMYLAKGEIYDATMIYMVMGILSIFGIALYELLFNRKNEEASEASKTKETKEKEALKNRKEDFTD